MGRLEIHIVNPLVEKTVFNAARKFVHPETGNQVWIFGDVHNTDVDTAGTISRLQREALLDAAKANNALVIAESASIADAYSPLRWVFTLCVDLLLAGTGYFFAFYGLAKGMASLAAAHTGVWIFQHWQQRKQVRDSADTIESFLRNLKEKHAPQDALQFYVHSPLYNLASYCKKKGVRVIDADFRFHMRSTILEDQRRISPLWQQGTLIMIQLKNWLMRKITGNKTLYTLTLRDYCDVNDAVLQDLAGWDLDNSILRNTYKKYVDAYRASYMTQELRAYAAQYPDSSLAKLMLFTIAPNLVQKYDKPATEIFRDFIEHNKELLDARIVHEIHAHASSYKEIFVCVGVDHVQRIADVLEQLGYHETESLGAENYKMLQDSGWIGKRNFAYVKELDFWVVDIQKLLAETAQ